MSIALTKNTALLVMDVQPNIVSRLDAPQDYLIKAQSVVAAAHKNSLLVIYVVVGFRSGLPEISPRNKSFSALKETAAAKMLNPEPSIPPLGSDVLVVKRRVSAFSGSDLEIILRSKGIEHLILTGIATSGVVLSTLREAADKDFQLTVLSDLCADFDETIHAVLLEKVFPKQANVVTSREWISSLEGAVNV